MLTVTTGRGVVMGVKTQHFSKKLQWLWRNTYSGAATACNVKAPVESIESFVHLESFRKRVRSHYRT